MELLLPAQAVPALSKLRSVAAPRKFLMVVAVQQLCVKKALQVLGVITLPVQVRVVQQA
jgi:hypothetical protein